MQKRKLGCDPAHSKLFLYTHTKNHDGVTFTNEKDRQIHVIFILVLNFYIVASS